MKNINLAMLNIIALFLIFYFASKMPSTALKLAGAVLPLLIIALTLYLKNKSDNKKLDLEGHNNPNKTSLGKSIDDR